MELLQKKAEPYVTEYGENQLPGAGQLLNSILRTGTEMVPGVGDLLGAEDLQTAAQNNDWGGIGLGALAAIPGIPSFSRGAGGDIRATARAVREAAETAPAPRVEPMTEAESALARYRAVNPNDTGARVLSPGDEGYPTNAQWDEASQAYVAPVEPDYPIRAFHGSPHSFDRFSLDKIGTGEGAQAYGHGLYFAESEDVARQYRDTLSGKLDNPLDRRGVDSAWVAAARDFRDNGYNPAQIEEALGQIYRTAEPEQISAAVRMSDPGSMYEVGINADPNTFLDWDRPLSEQPEPVRSALSDMRPDATGGQILESSRLVPGDYFDRQAATRALAERGIPGIRYLDAGSRGVGEGSSNYVVFNDDLVKILRKYGIGGLSTTVGASALAEELDRRGQTQEF